MPIKYPNISCRESNYFAFFNFRYKSLSHFPNSFFRPTMPATKSESVPYEKGIKKPNLTSTSPAKNEKVLKYTPISDIPGIVKRLNTSFHEQGKTHNLQYRLNQLRNIYFALQDNKERICDALFKDFNRAPSETMNLEFAIVMSHLLHTMSQLHKWSAPEKVLDLPVNMRTSPVYIEKIPLGTVLVISPFNYPLLLSIDSIVAAISAGNCVVLKLTELTPHFSQLLTEILSNSLDPDTFAMINGGIEETTVVLDQKFDKIMYTGSTQVGTIIAKKAAETLTPVLLELGGKSPAFVLADVKDSDLNVIAKRIAWGRYTNAGQTCVAIDYVLAHDSVKDKLVAALARVIKEEFYEGLTARNTGYTHIIHKRAFDNIRKMIESTRGNVIVGGKADEESRFIPPTLIDNATWEDSTMQQEIFGPVLPILSYLNLSEAISEVIKRHDTPLALYIFTSGSQLRTKNREVDMIRQAIRSGGTIVNDSVLQVGLQNAPFGGIGQSGQGAYHGYYSYRAFSHERTTIELSLAMDFAMKVRYPPVSEKKDAVVQASQEAYNGAVWFDRTGNVAVGGPNVLWSAWHTGTGLMRLVYRVMAAL